MSMSILTQNLSSHDERLSQVAAPPDNIEIVASRVPWCVSHDEPHTQTAIWQWPGMMKYEREVDVVMIIRNDPFSLQDVIVCVIRHWMYESGLLWCQSRAQGPLDTLWVQQRQRIWWNRWGRLKHAF